MVHVALTSLNKNYKEIKSTAESYNQIKKKSASSVDDSANKNSAIDFEISGKIPMTKSSEFNVVLPESNSMELQRSYQTKHKKIDKEVHSLVNWLSKNNKDAIQNKEVSSVEDKMNNERTEKASPSGKKHAIIVG